VLLRWRRTTPASGYIDVTFRRRIGHGKTSATRVRDPERDGLERRRRRRQQGSGERGLSAGGVPRQEQNGLSTRPKRAFSRRVGELPLQGDRSGLYRVGEVVPSGWRRTSLLGYFDVSLSSGGRSREELRQHAEGVFSGTVFNDLNGNGIRTRARRACQRPNLLDADKDGVWDSTERSCSPARR
jgi:hypothetical protein